MKHKIYLKRSMGVLTKFKLAPKAILSFEGDVQEEFRIFKKYRNKISALAHQVFGSRGDNNDGQTDPDPRLSGGV
jgi:hypothetical protein